MQPDNLFLLLCFVILFGRIVLGLNDSDLDYLGVSKNADSETL